MLDYSRAFLVLAPALGALTSFLVLHLALWQLLPRPHKGTLALSLTALAAYVLLGGAAALWLEGTTFSGLIWSSGPVYAFLVMLYFHFYFGMDRSVSVRILGELAQAATGRLTMSQLDGVYSKRGMIRLRLDVLVAKGHLELVNGCYQCTPKGRRLVRFALAGKKVYNLDITG